MSTAKSRYDALSSGRNQFLQTAVDASKLTLPYLIKQDEEDSNYKTLITPWQSVGAKGVTTLASKLMLALLPPQTSFFKLQIDESTILSGELDPAIRSDLDASFAKIERTILESIAASDDRVIIHQAIKHLVVSGNALVYMDKDKLKLYPLSRYVVERDGLGNVIEIVTKEKVHRSLIKGMLKDLDATEVNRVDDESTGYSREDADVYTIIKRDNNRFVWHQEVYDKIIPNSQGKAPLDTSPW